MAFFDLQAGVQLAIWPRASIARDTGIPASPPSPTEFTLGHNVSSKAEVDAVMEQARAGYFEDPDRHLWEVVWNPQIPVED